MKITITGKDCKIVAENPDEKFEGYVQQKIQDAIATEIGEFFEEIRVALRHLKPGEAAQLESKPIRVEIIREPEPSK